MEQATIDHGHHHHHHNHYHHHPFGPFHIPHQSIRDKLRINPPPTTAAANDSNNNSSHDTLSLPPPPRSPYFALSYSSPPPSSFSRSFPVDHRTTNPQPGSLDAMSANGALNLSLATTNQSTGTGTGSMLSPPRWQTVVTASPVGPFTGYASILGRSRYLKVAQEMLEEFCGPYRGRVRDSALGSNVAALEAADSAAWGDGDVDGSAFGAADRSGDAAGLVSMLHEVYRRYRLYYQQMHSAVTSFEAVAGLGNAAPFLSLAIQTISMHFRCLKNAIIDHIQYTSKVFQQGGGGSAAVAARPDPSVLDNQKQLLQSSSSSSFLQSPAWRSQRGFPDKAVTVLRTWLFENFLHPYPTDSDKQMLAQRTGLSRNQVSNWFTNARVRLWKPMVEEIYALERRADQFPTKVESRPGMANNMSAGHYSSDTRQLREESQLPSNLMKVQDDHQHTDASLTGVCNDGEQNNKEQFMVMPTDQHLTNYIGGSLTGRHKIDYPPAGSNQVNSLGLAWTPHVQGIPFWLGK